MNSVTEHLQIGPVQTEFFFLIWTGKVELRKFTKCGTSPVCLKYFSNVYFASLHVDECIHAAEHTWSSADNLQKSVLISILDPGDQS